VGVVWEWDQLPMDNYAIAEIFALCEVVTLEDEPRIIELRGDEVQKVNHAYGTNGIITQLEMPLAPAYPWGRNYCSI
jgi:FAD/FMN-containing dehydrogenase